MAEYGDLRGPLNEIARALRFIERNTCGSCVGSSVASTENFLVTPAVTTAVLKINGNTIGTGVSAAYASLAALVTALNAAYTGLAVFYLNADNSITITSTNPGKLSLSITSV